MNNVLYKDEYGRVYDTFEVDALDPWRIDDLGIHVYERAVA